MALGLENGMLLLRDRTNGANIDVARLPGHRAAVVSLSFAADGKRMASGDRDGRIQVWQASAGGTWDCKRVVQIDRPTRSSRDVLGPTIAVALTPDGQYLAACSSDHGVALVRNLATEAPATEFRGLGGENLRCLAFSPDGRLLAAGYHRTGAHGVLVWDVATGQLKKPEITSPFAVAQVVFSRDGRRLGAARVEAGIALFDTSTFLRDLYMIADCTLGLAFSPDSQWVATTGTHGEIITLCDVFRNREVGKLTHPDHVEMVAFSTDGKALVTAGPGSVRIWNLAGAEEKLTLSGHGGGVPGLAFSPDGKLLASAGKDGMVKIWDPATGRCIRDLTGFREPPEPVAFSPDSRLLAAGDKAGTVRIWDVASWKELPVSAQDIGREVYAVSFSPDGKYFAAGGGVGPDEPGGVVVWHRGDGASLLERPLRVTSAAVRSLSFSTDSSMLAWVDSFADPVCVHLWDLRSSRGWPFPQAPAHGHIHALAFRNGMDLVSIDPTGLPVVWNVATRQQTLSLGSGGSQFLALSTDGTWLAQGGLAPRIWDLESKKLLLVLPEERAPPWSYAWSPDKAHLAVGSPGGELVIWNLLKVKAQLDAIGLGW
jgi:WD40 repeat protein